MLLKICLNSFERCTQTVYQYLLINYLNFAEDNDQSEKSDSEPDQDEQEKSNVPENIDPQDKENEVSGNKKKKRSQNKCLNCKVPFIYYVSNFIAQKLI